jgi:hypothetical protein
LQNRLAANARSRFARAHLGVMQTAQSASSDDGELRDQLFAIFRPPNSPRNRDSPAGRWRRRRTRIIRTIDGFTLFAAMPVPVPVLMVLGIVGRGIIGAGAEREAEKKQDQFPFPEAA